METVFENNNITVGELAAQIQLILKDELIATVHRKGSEIDLTFLNGQSFTLTLFENYPKNS